MSSNQRDLWQMPEYVDGFRHHIPLQFRFNDVDLLGHVNNSVYQQFYDLGRLRYFEDVVGVKADWNGNVVVVAHLEIDFFQGLTIDDTASVATRTTHFGNRSFRLEQLIYNSHSPVVYARSESVMVGFHGGKQVSAPLPVGWREAIQRYEGLEANS